MKPAMRAWPLIVAAFSAHAGQLVPAASATPAAPAPAAPPTSGVRVLIGPTPIPGGDARASGDITVIDSRLAFSLAVQSAAPYGVPRGALVDAAKVEHGRIGRDTVEFADFIPNNWSAWPNSHHEVEILERGPQRAVLRTRRDWGRVEITTVYTLAAGSDSIQIDTTMKNDGRRTLRNLLSGMTLWPKGGFLFGVPGLGACPNGSSHGALADRVVAYDARWSLTLHAPYMDRVENGCRDLYRLHTLRPGQSREFHASLQVGSSGDLAPAVRADIALAHLPSARIHGRVSTEDGAPVARPVVVVSRDGAPYAWTYGRDGNYDMELPAGRYAVYAAAKDTSQSAAIPVTLAPGADATRDFHDLRRAGRVSFTVTDAATGAPLDARIVIDRGYKPLVQFLGRRTFFTELDRPGHAAFAIAPGHYVFRIDSGGGFLGPAQRLPADIAPGRTTRLAVHIDRLFAPKRHGWFAADLHHHADQAEAVTPPAYLARSELAAGLDLLFVSDHDSTVNHRALERIAERRGVPFIPSVEFSPSWGHFNAYPLELGAIPRLDSSTATVQQVFAEARRLGATIVEVNHPFIPYGYFHSLADGVAPGGFDPAFDLVEINAANAYDDDRVLHRLWTYWNAGDRYYLGAGTDTHDVWNEVSGRVRTFAHIDGAPTAALFADALRDGHAYVSYGPLIYPRVMFGSDLKVRSGVPFTLRFRLASVAGLRQLTLIENGQVRATKRFSGAQRLARTEFQVSVRRSRWFALTAVDRDGHKAYTNPIWVDVVSPPQAAPADAVPPGTDR